jgi:hypothetical protein
MASIGWLVGYWFLNGTPAQKAISGLKEATSMASDRINMTQNL